MKINSVNYLISIFLTVAVTAISCATAIRVGGGDAVGLTQTTRKPDYSDLYDKIDENDIFKNVRHIMRNGDPANGVPSMVPLSRTHEYDINK